MEQAGLRAVPKLTKAHIAPNAFQKMSVRLAVQARNSLLIYTLEHVCTVIFVTEKREAWWLKIILCVLQLFSESTASAMEFYSTQEACEKLRHSAATSRFTRRMNMLFDSLNSRRPEHVMYNEAEHIAVSD